MILPWVMGEEETTWWEGKYALRGGGGGWSHGWLPESAISGRRPDATGEDSNGGVP